ncbi:adenylate kinase [Paenibacillus peoriae]|uniref:deoxynucleotide monophosphate kinase family protein n=1 Tax=Paenibacillus peoriae TaxID=59893 RepID=UPI003F974749
MTTLPNIGLLGRLRSGKDEVARYLSDNYGYMQFAFGDELKADFHRRYPEIPREAKPRAGYQAHGQLMRALVDEDIWVRKCLAEVKRAYYAHLDFRAVISDVRQPNEEEALTSAGYVLIRVEAPDAVRIDRAIKSGDVFNYTDLVHDTETALDGYAADFTVTNDGTLDKLHAQIDEILRKITGNGGEWPE